MRNIVISPNDKSRERRWRVWEDNVEQYYYFSTINVVVVVVVVERHLRKFAQSKKNGQCVRARSRGVLDANEYDVCVGSDDMRIFCGGGEREEFSAARVLYQRIK
jgi:hypothetical protein